jgi:hypothetical protein
MTPLGPVPACRLAQGWTISWIQSVKRKCAPCNSTNKVTGTGEEAEEEAEEEQAGPGTGTETDPTSLLLLSRATWMRGREREGEAVVIQLWRLYAWEKEE